MLKNQKQSVKQFLLNSIKTNGISKNRKSNQSYSSRPVKLFVQYSLATRLLAVLLINGLLLPLVFFGQVAPKFNSTGNISSSGYLGSIFNFSGSGFASSADPLDEDAIANIAAVDRSLANGYRAVADYLTTPTAPEGFSNARIPSLLERVYGDVSSIASTVVSPFTATSVAASPAPGIANYDFTGDGKADAARWQLPNGEWKIKDSTGGSL